MPKFIQVSDKEVSMSYSVRGPILIDELLTNQSESFSTAAGTVSLNGETVRNPQLTQNSWWYAHLAFRVAFWRGSSNDNAANGASMQRGYTAQNLGGSGV